MANIFQKMIAEKKQELSKNMPASKQKNIDKRLRYYTEQEAIERIYQILLNNARFPGSILIVPSVILIIVLFPKMRPG